ncbi:MAG TPA: DUF6311 domain-containing protein [Vicinamibacterales bacterium]|nr:DUF6311 domain-containing protein [Vicinamibacterales bacterium]
MGRVLGAIVGAAFFIWIAGTRVLDPGEIGWLMRFDWPVHFFGWHFFRHEPWQWPPGLIRTYGAPMGTAIGFTDSIPLVVLALKPFSAWLPATFQYIGGWLFLCFTLQGLSGAWLMSQWSGRTWHQVLAAVLFVMMPVLLIRIGHPALCAQWLLVWVLVIAARDVRARFRTVEWGLLGLIAGLLHPYLAVMALALLVAVVLTPAPQSSAPRAAALAAAMTATMAGWWISGLFSVSGAGSMATEGLGYYSMNLLGPITPAGWSVVLPDLPRATPGQEFEGFQYLGLGTLLLMAGAAGLWLRRGPHTPKAQRGPAVPMGFGRPVLAVALLMAAFALSPRVTLGGAVLVDLSGPWADPLSVFRSTGRFFWPMAYLSLAWALSVVATRLPSRVGLTLLLCVVVVQAVDLHGAHEERRRSARDPAFYAWSDPMASPAWNRILVDYDHLVLYPPSQCGTPPMPFEPAAYHAGLAGLSINTGGAARPDLSERMTYCHDLGERLKAGLVEDDSLYIVDRAEMQAIRDASHHAAVCGLVTGVPVCASAASYQRWRDVADLQ